MKTFKRDKSKKLEDEFYQGNSISFLDIITVLAKNLRVIIFTPIFFVLYIIFYVIFFAEPTYISKSKIMSSSSGGLLSQASGFALQLGINIPIRNSEKKWNYPEVIKSRTLARSVIKRKFKTIKFEEEKTLLEIFNDGNLNSEVPLNTLESLGTGKLLNMINVFEDKKNSIITINVSSSEPKLASDINHAIIKELDLHQRRYNKDRASETKKFIEERIVDIELELIKAEEALRDFTNSNRRIDNSPLLLLEQQRLSREVTVLTEVFTTLKQQLETTKIEEVKDANYVVVLDLPEVPLGKASPNSRLLVILALFMGLSFGILVAFINEYFEKSKSNKKNKIKEIKSILKYNFFNMFTFFNR